MTFASAGDHVLVPDSAYGPNRGLADDVLRRFGVDVEFYPPMIGAGIALMATATAVALTGVTVAHFVVALALVGVGWNFMYTGGTTLLTESYRPAEKARVQGVNDLILFVTLAMTSLTSGALVTAAGWETANWAGVPVLAVIAVAVATLAWQRRAIPARA